MIHKTCKISASLDWRINNILLRFMGLQKASPIELNKGVGEILKVM